MMPTSSIAELSDRRNSLTEDHKQWQQTIGIHWDGVIETLSAHVEALRRKRVEYERQAFTEPITVLNDQLGSAREEYRECLRDFVPKMRRRDPAVRPLVPVVCSVFHTHDTLMDAGGAVGHRLPWDVVGGVIAVLFPEIVSMSLSEYRQREDDLSGRVIALQGCLRDDRGEFDPPRTGSGITLDVSGVRGIHSLWHAFLSDCDEARLETLSTILFGSSLRSITAIPGCFCSGNIRLKNLQIDEDSLLNVATIDEWFLENCRSLRSVDLRPLRNVTAIGVGFLSDCKAFESIDLSPFHQVTSISAHFLSGCSSLTAIDLSPLRSVTTVSFYGWLTGCESVRGTIDLTSLRGVKEVGGTSYDKHEFQFLHLGTSDDLPVGSIRVLVPAENAEVVNAVHTSIEGYDDCIAVEEVSFDEEGIVDDRT